MNIWQLINRLKDQISPKLSHTNHYLYTSQAQGEEKSILINLPFIHPPNQRHPIHHTLLCLSRESTEILDLIYFILLKFIQKII